MRFQNILAALLCGSFLFPWTTQAHDYWIQPDTFHLAEPGWISFDFAAGHADFRAEENPMPNGFALDWVGPDGELEPVPAYWSGHRKATGEVFLGESGTWLLCGVSRVPQYYTRLKDGTGLGVSRDQIPEGEKGRTGAYIKSVKTFLTLGEASQKPLEPRGYTIELVPHQSLHSVEPGQELSFVLLFEGKALPNSDIFAVTTGHRAHSEQHQPPVQKKTDPQGRVQLQLHKSGRWLIYSRYEVETPEDPQAHFYNYRAYLMLEVGHSKK